MTLTLIVRSSSDTLWCHTMAANVNLLPFFKEEFTAQVEQLNAPVSYGIENLLCGPATSVAMACRPQVSFSSRGRCLRIRIYHSVNYYVIVGDPHIRGYAFF